MITGYNLTLKPPKIIYKSENLIFNNPEVVELIKAIKEYFDQENVIYAADLTLSNNDWETHQSEFGPYKERQDYTFRLMDLTKIILYDDNITFIIYNEAGKDIDFNLKITKDFFWFFDWESSYYY